MWPFRKRPPKIQPPNERCENCRYFLDYRDVEPDDEVNGYCGHPDHSDPKKSSHHEYGGQWTHHLSWCDWWRGKPDGKS